MTNSLPNYRLKVDTFWSLKGEDIYILMNITDKEKVFVLKGNVAKLFQHLQSPTKFPEPVLKNPELREKIIADLLLLEIIVSA